MSFKLHFNPLFTVEFITLLLVDGDDDDDANDDEKYKISYSTGVPFETTTHLISFEQGFRYT